MAALTLASAVACRAAGQAATATPEVIADCFWSAEALAWVDADGNGQRDGATAVGQVELTLADVLSGGRPTPRAWPTSACRRVRPAWPTAWWRRAGGYAPTRLAWPPEQDRYEFSFQPNP
jgi:hypothetical protein